MVKFASRSKVFMALMVAGWHMCFSLVAQVILSEDFENGVLPPGWSKSQAATSQGWLLGDSGTLASPFWAIPSFSTFAASNDDACNCDMSEDLLLLPQQDFSNLVAPRLIFDTYYTGLLGSIALVEVSTDGGVNWIIVDSLEGDGSWREERVNLQAFGGIPNVLIAFHHDDRGGWTGGFAVDNVRLEEPFAVDASLLASSLSDYVAVGTPLLPLWVRNSGSSPILSLDFSYRINGGLIQADRLEMVNMLQDSTALITHSVPMNLPQAQTYSIEAWIDAVNDQADQQMLNDTIRFTLTALSQVPPKYVILQDHTGAWCQFCPQASALTNEIAAADSLVIPVIVHVNDAMAFPQGESLSQTYVDAYPSAIVDQASFPQFEGIATLRQEEWSERVAAGLDVAVPVRVEIEQAEYNADSRLMEALVSAEFFGPVQGDLRFNLWVIEDSVTGVGAGYDQANIFHTQPGHPFEGAGNPITDYVHRHTLRAMLGGTWGLQGSLPASVSGGQQYTQAFSWQVPAGYQADRLKLIGLVQRYDSVSVAAREILNSKMESLQNKLTSSLARAEWEDFEIGPNPFRDEVRIRFRPGPGPVYVQIFDATGKELWQKELRVIAGETIEFAWDGQGYSGAILPAGIYYLQIITEGAKIARPIYLMR